MKFEEVFETLIKLAKLHPTISNDVIKALFEILWDAEKNLLEDTFVVFYLDLIYLGYGDCITRDDISLYSILSCDFVNLGTYEKLEEHMNGEVNERDVDTIANLLLDLGFSWRDDIFNFWLKGNDHPIKARMIELERPTTYERPDLVTEKNPLGIPL